MTRPNVRDSLCFLDLRENMSSKPSPSPERVMEGFLRTPITDVYVKIRTVCKQCQAELVGNADRVKEWEIDHLNKCAKMD